MTARSWHSELERFQRMTERDQIIWLAQLLHLVSMFARDTYDIGRSGVSKPAELRRFNELSHRIATFTKKIAKTDASGMPAKDMFELIEVETNALGVPAEELLKRLP
jgi:hypothetical protein